MNSVLLSVILYVLGAIAGIWFGLHSAKDSFTLNSSHSTTMLGDGGRNRERAKILNKEPVRDPGVGSSTTNMAYGQPQLPDMRGIDYDRYGNVSSATVGNATGVGITNVIGLVNGIGGINQGGDIHNKFKAKRQLLGPVRQQGMIYNNGIKKIETANQIGNGILNTSRGGKFAIIQNGNGIKTAIGKGKTSVNSTGSSKNYLSGDIRTLKSGKGDIYAPKVQIKGVSKFSSLYTRNLRLAKRQLLSQGITKEKDEFDDVIGKRHIIMNSVNLINLGKRKYTTTTANSGKRLCLETIAAEDPNGELSIEQRNTLASLYSQMYVMSLLGNISTNLNLSKQVIKENPEIKDVRKILEITNRVMPVMAQNKKRLELNAALETRKKKSKQDMQDENIGFLNEIIKTDTSIGTQFNNFVDKAYEKKIREQAIANIEKRNEMTLEEKEREHAIQEESKKLLESGSEEEKRAFEDKIKQKVLEDPEGAKKIIGEKGVEQIKVQIKNTTEKIYQQNLEKQENIADNEFLKTHDEYKNADQEKVREERYKAELKEAIDQVMNEMNRRENYERDRRRKEDYISNMNTSVPQPTGSASVYIPRSVQDRMAKRENG